jgi:hypothetical protein
MSRSTRSGFEKLANVGGYVQWGSSNTPWRTAPPLVVYDAQGFELPPPPPPPVVVLLSTFVGCKLISPDSQAINIAVLEAKTRTGVILIVIS